MKREKVIQELIVAEKERIALDPDLFSRIIRNGYSGFNNYDNSELENLYKNFFNEEITISD